MSTRILVEVLPDAVRVFSDSPDVQVLVIDRDTRTAETVLTAAGQGAKLSSLLGGLPLVDAAHVQEVFAEVGGQLAELESAPELGHSARVQLANLQSAWFPSAS